MNADTCDHCISLPNSRIHLLKPQSDESDNLLTGGKQQNDDSSDSDNSSESESETETSSQSSSSVPTDGSTSEDVEDGTRSKHKSFFLTDSRGEHIRDSSGKPKLYFASKPGLAAQKAFYSWRREYNGIEDTGSAVKVSDDIREWLDNLRGVTTREVDIYMRRLRSIKKGEIDTGVEIFIRSDNKMTPKRYVCSQHLNETPNVHQVKKLIVLQSRAHPCQTGLPQKSVITKLLTPFS